MRSPAAIYGLSNGAEREGAVLEPLLEDGAGEVAADEAREGVEDAEDDRGDEGDEEADEEDAKLRCTGDERWRRVTVPAA